MKKDEKKKRKQIRRIWVFCRAVNYSFSCTFSMRPSWLKDLGKKKAIIIATAQTPATGYMKYIQI
ncbi:hypothetical protein [Candidatus Lokiarchaeum ossiferum]|uniref:hypothetical protein n=1 Tax=Candidatus Lokiarchaeum ossiferum TaxID=2951803 RepID=UPI00352FD14E